MKKYFLFVILFFVFPGLTFGTTPADTMGIGMQALTCPDAADYKICGGINHDLHNQFVSLIKKKDALKAIQIWDKMIDTIDGSSYQGLENYLANPLIGTIAPEGIMPMPSRIFAKKAYKGGILYIGTSVQDFDFNLFYVGYMKYRSIDDTLYFYNNQIVPLGSPQYKSYSRLYKNPDQSFENDLKKSFYKGKFNNIQVNAIYQKMVRSIR